MHAWMIPINVCWHRQHVDTVNGRVTEQGSRVNRPRHSRRGACGGGSAASLRTGYWVPIPTRSVYLLVMSVDEETLGEQDQRDRECDASDRPWARPFRSSRRPADDPVRNALPSRILSTLKLRPRLAVCALLPDDLPSSGVHSDSIRIQPWTRNEDGDTVS
jgi:hypothetical protein